MHNDIDETIGILQSYPIWADLHNSELWKSKLPAIRYFHGTWLTSYMFIFILISQIQLYEYT